MQIWAYIDICQRFWLWYLWWDERSNILSRKVTCHFSSWKYNSVSKQYQNLWPTAERLHQSQGRVSTVRRDIFDIQTYQPRLKPVTLMRYKAISQFRLGLFGSTFKVPTAPSQKLSGPKSQGWNFVWGHVNENPRIQFCIQYRDWTFELGLHLSVQHQDFNLPHHDVGWTCVRSARISSFSRGETLWNHWSVKGWRTSGKGLFPVFMYLSWNWDKSGRLFVGAQEFDRKDLKGEALRAGQDSLSEDNIASHIW